MFTPISSEPPDIHQIPYPWEKKILKESEISMCNNPTASRGVPKGLADRLPNSRQDSKTQSTKSYINRNSTIHNINIGYIGKRVLFTSSKVDIQTTTLSYDNNQKQVVDPKEGPYADHQNRKKHLNCPTITN